ncbi:MAG: hypothetical protein C4523_11235 [Myxococcales bacterium]|nr:MAG: hypothetical protein C4523_11235 [Myxococcales bacterium]
MQPHHPPPPSDAASRAAPQGQPNRPWEVYTVRDKGERAFWTKIGAAFKNADGSFRVLLDALPVNGSLTILPPKE